MLELLLNNKGLALALLSAVFSLEKFGFTTPKVGIAEVGVDRPLEGVFDFTLLLGVLTLVFNNSSSPFFLKNGIF